jgi:hypothetical protein
MEEYIRRAEDAERQARGAATETERKTLQRIADFWRELAHGAAKRASPGER